MELESMALEMPEVSGHPNRTAFRGVLTLVDVPSQRAPAGSKGHRVMLTKRAAEAAIPSLLGMAVDYTPSYDRHDTKRKVGVITTADIAGHNLEISGYLYAKDFPDVVEEIAKSGRTPMRLPKEDGAGQGHSAAAQAMSEGEKLRSALAAAVESLREVTRKQGEMKLSASVRSARADAGLGSGLGMSFEVMGVSVADKKARIWKLTGVTFTGAAILRKNKAAYEDTWIELS